LDTFDVENIKLEVLLFQAGYLTIKEVIITEEEDILYSLKFPNKEVRMSFNKFVIPYLTGELYIQERQ
jgi:hypothetical protein